jgi:Zn-dependent peptidase ImmA (M78 family)/DNA-binding XRE family transcriptional regulator
MFSPSRLTIARSRRGWTMGELAKAAGLSSKTIGSYESGHTEPDPDAQAVLARVLRFPLSFFHAGDLDVLLPEAASFRSLASMTAVQRNAALAAGSLAVELSQWIERRLELPRTDILDLRNAEAEAAAETVRRQWAIGERPIGNLVHLLERSGIRVFSLSEQCREVDAFSLWRGDTPFIFLNTQKSPEHSRFDAAHELGHLVLHRHGPGGCDGAPEESSVRQVRSGRRAADGRHIEEEANAFAAALLLPRRTLLSMTPRVPTLAKLIEIKRIWRVSLTALIHRLHRIKALTPWQYRQLCIEASREGYREREPEGLTERETSQLLAKALEELRLSGHSRSDIARALHLPSNEFEGLIFGLIISALEGSAEEASPPRGQLRLVE